MPLNRWRQGVIPCCVDKGPVSCCQAEFLSASISTFHTKRLANATRDINAILEDVMNHDEDRPPEADQISILETPDGPFLAWTQSSDEGTVIENADEIRRFLGT